uniref:NADH dehydrogenase subunit 2 n=1 Tax=Microcotyle sebastis TaxID=116890 RepID=A3QRI1_MICSE|nr:NADH dehydrogenase subunit 2 [Microcotyle sebastis]
MLNSVNVLLVWLFSLLCFFMSLINNSTATTLFLLECLAMLVIPLTCYSNNGLGHTKFNSIALFFVVSSLSGLVFLYSLIFNMFETIFYVLLLKFGLFPFCWWIYGVYSGIGLWLLVYLNTVFKAPIIWLTGLGGISLDSTVLLILFLTVFYCSYMLLSQTSGWYTFLASSSIMTSSVYLLLLNNVSQILFFAIFFVGWLYLFMYIYLLFSHNFYEKENLSINEAYSYSFFTLFMALPFSVTAIYKLINVYGIILLNSLGFIILWLVYQIIEQLWLLNFFFNNNSINVTSEVINSRLV